MLQRILISVCLLLSVFLLPWWITIPALLGTLLFVPRYLEGCGIACVFDLAYAGTPLFGMAGVVTVTSVIVYLFATYFILPRLRHDVFSAS